MLISRNEEETKEIGRRIGRKLRIGDIVCLYGELGSGKTTMVKGIASAIGVNERDITSPSFIIISEHNGILPLYHIDLYRTETGQINDLGLEDYMYGNGVSVIEWAERLGEAISDKCVKVRLTYGEDNTREIEIEGIEL